MLGNPKQGRLVVILHSENTEQTEAVKTGEKIRLTSSHPLSVFWQHEQAEIEMVILSD